MTSIDDVIQPGQPIPDDVTRIVDNEAVTWILTSRGHWHLSAVAPFCATGTTCARSGPPMAKHAPFTVTAVREQPAEPHQQQAGASLLLNLVRRYGLQERQDGGSTRDPASPAAAALLARIAALMPQQPVQARSGLGFPWWHHGCGEVAKGGVPPRLHGCDTYGPWRPLFVDGDPAPEPDLIKEFGAQFGSFLARQRASERSDRHEPHVDGPREPSAQERADHDLMAALGVEQLDEVIPAIEHLKALVDHLHNWRSEHDKRERERDAARAEVERLTVELAVEREAEERGNAELKDIVRRLDEAGVNNGGASERVGYAIQSMRQGWATARNHLASLDTVKSDRETIRGSLNYLKDTVTGPAIKLLGVQHNEDIVPAIERLKATQPDPRKLSLPKVPEGTEALTGIESGRRYARGTDSSGETVWAAGIIGGTLGEVLDGEPDGVRVELAPPREPRTWSKLDPVPDDLRHVRGASGTVYDRTPGTCAFSGYRNGESVTRNLHILRAEDGPLDEVLK